MEGVTARDSGAVIPGKRNGIVDSVDSQRIIVRVEANITRRNCRARWVPTSTRSSVQAVEPEHLHQSKAVVREGDRVSKARSLPTACTEQGELALGRNVLVPSCPGAVTLEDAILISEKLVREDYYTSVHMRSSKSRLATRSWAREIHPPTFPM